MVVHPRSHRVSRVRRYSGSCQAVSVFAYGILTLFDAPSHALRLTVSVPSAVQTPQVFLPTVWPLPRSLATTDGISVDVSSSPYLDVSVQAVPHVWLWIYHTLRGHDPAWVSPFRNVRIADHLHLPVPFRSLSRLSSALSAKAFALRPF